MIVLLGSYDWNIGNCFGYDSLRPEIGLKTFYALASVFYNLCTILYKFPEVLTRRICLTIKNFFSS